MKIRKYTLAILLIGYAILWIGGIGSYIFLKQPPPEANWAAPAFLFLAGFIVLISSEKKDALLLLLSGIIGLASEIIGIHTGYPYGAYEYTQTIKPSFLGVPLVMLTAWIILPAYIRQILLNAKLKKLILILISALSLVFLDLLIDPVAIGPMNFWSWIDTGPYYGIPTLNFFGWFMVGFIIFSFLSNSTTKNQLHLYIGASVILFFTLIAFSESLLLAGLAGVLTIAAQLCLTIALNIKK